jgi:anaerobic magnesium-protoporphyrin IX monomethyl ester cyclase
MQILLVQPWNVSYRAAVPVESLGLGYVAAVLRQNGLEVEILDGLILGLTANQLAEAIIQRNPAIVGFSVHGQALAETTWRIIQLIRAKECQAHICLGGIFPSIEYKRILENWFQVDSIVMGEGEYTFLQLAQNVLNGESLNNVTGLAYRSLTDKITINPPRRRIFNLDQLPFPVRDTLPIVLNAVQSTQIQAGRGCSHSRCSFCSIAVFYNFRPEVTLRSAELVVEEIARIIKEYDCRFFHFSDDNFVDQSDASQQWADSFCRAISRRKIKISFRINVRADCVEEHLMADLRRAGLWEASIGVEAGSQSTLDKYCKGTTTADNALALHILESLGIKHKPNLILFDPYISWSDLKATLQYMNQTQIRSLKGFFRILVPYAGTPIRARMIHDGLLEEKNFWDLGPYRFQDPYIIQLYTLLQETYSELTTLNHSISEIKHRWIWQLSEFNQVFGLPLTTPLSTLLTDMVNFNQRIESYIIELVEELIKLVETEQIHCFDDLMQRYKFKERVKGFQEEAENIRRKALQMADPILLRK